MFRSATVLLIGTSGYLFVALSTSCLQPFVMIIKKNYLNCCGSGMIIPDPNFFIPNPRSKTFRIPYPHQKSYVLLTKKIVCKLSEIWSGMFIPDPDLDFLLRIPNPGGKKAPLPGSGSATLSNWFCWQDQQLAPQMWERDLREPHRRRARRERGRERASGRERAQPQLRAPVGAPAAPAAAACGGSTLTILRASRQVVKIKFLWELLFYRYQRE